MMYTREYLKNIEADHNYSWKPLVFVPQSFCAICLGKIQYHGREVVCENGHNRGEVSRDGYVVESVSANYSQRGHVRGHDRGRHRT